MLSAQEKKNLSAYNYSIKYYLAGLDEKTGLLAEIKASESFLDAKDPSLLLDHVRRLKINEVSYNDDSQKMRTIYDFLHAFFGELAQKPQIQHVAKKSAKASTLVIESIATLDHPLIRIHKKAVELVEKNLIWELWDEQLVSAQKFLDKDNNQNDELKEKQEKFQTALNYFQITCSVYLNSDKAVVNHDEDNLLLKDLQVLNNRVKQILGEVNDNFEHHVIRPDYTLVTILEEIGTGRLPDASMKEHMEDLRRILLQQEFSLAVEQLQFFVSSYKNIALGTVNSYSFPILFAYFEQTIAQIDSALSNKIQAFYANEKLDLLDVAESMLDSAVRHIKGNSKSLDNRVYHGVMETLGYALLFHQLHTILELEKKLASSQAVPLAQDARRIESALKLIRGATIREPLDNSNKKLIESRTKELKERRIEIQRRMYFFLNKNYIDQANSSRNASYEFMVQLLLDPTGIAAELLLWKLAINREAFYLAIYLHLNDANEINPKLYQFIDKLLSTDKSVHAERLSDDDIYALSETVQDVKELMDAETYNTLWTREIAKTLVEPAILKHAPPLIGYSRSMDFDAKSLMTSSTDEVNESGQLAIKDNSSAAQLASAVFNMAYNEEIDNKQTGAREKSDLANKLQNVILSHKSLLEQLPSEVIVELAIQSPDFTKTLTQGLKTLILGSSFLKAEKMSPESILRLITGGNDIHRNIVLDDANLRARIFDAPLNVLQEFVEKKYDFFMDKLLPAVKGTDKENYKILSDFAYLMNKKVSLTWRVSSLRRPVPQKPSKAAINFFVNFIVQAPEFFEGAMLADKEIHSFDMVISDADAASVLALLQDLYFRFDGRNENLNPEAVSYHVQLENKLLTERLNKNTLEMGAFMEQQVFWSYYAKNVDKEILLSKNTFAIALHEYATGSKTADKAQDNIRMFFTKISRVDNNPIFPFRAKMKLWSDPYLPEDSPVRKMLRDSCTPEQQAKLDKLTISPDKKLGLSKSPSYTDKKEEEDLVLPEVASQGSRSSSVFGSSSGTSSALITANIGESMKKQQLSTSTSTNKRSISFKSPFSPVAEGEQTVSSSDQTKNQTQAPAEQKNGGFFSWINWNRSSTPISSSASQLPQETSDEYMRAVAQQHEQGEKFIQIAKEQLRAQEFAKAKEEEDRKKEAERMREDALKAEEEKRQSQFAINQEQRLFSTNVAYRKPAEIDVSFDNEMQEGPIQRTSVDLAKLQALAEIIERKQSEQTRRSFGRRSSLTPTKKDKEPVISSPIKASDTVSQEINEEIVISAPLPVSVTQQLEKQQAQAQPEPVSKPGFGFRKSVPTTPTKSSAEVVKEQLAEQQRKAAEEIRLAEEARKKEEAKQPSAPATKSGFGFGFRKSVPTTPTKSSAEVEKEQLAEQQRKVAEEKRLAEEARKKEEAKQPSASAAKSGFGFGFRKSAPTTPTKSQAELEKEQLAEQQRKADEEIRLAEEAQRKADEEKRLAEETQRKADGEKRLAEEAQRKANEEKRLADETQRKADEEKRLAEEAQRKADEEKRLAEEAQRKAAEEKRLAEEAQRKAQEEAQRKADEEKRLADEAQHKADEEKRLADEAQRKADEEKRLADEAQRKAAEEKRLADEAQRKAEEEKRLADEAQRKAAEEKRLADEAQRKADEEKKHEVEANLLVQQVHLEQIELPIEKVIMKHPLSQEEPTEIKDSLNQEVSIEEPRSTFTPEEQEKIDKMAAERLRLEEEEEKEIARIIGSKARELAKADNKYYEQLKGSEQRRYRELAQQALQGNGKSAPISQADSSSGGVMEWVEQKKDVITSKAVSTLFPSPTKEEFPAAEVAPGAVNGGKLSPSKSSGRQSPSKKEAEIAEPKTPVKQSQAPVPAKQTEGTPKRLEM